MPTLSHPTHGKRVFGNTMGRRNGLDSKQSFALLRLDPTALAAGFDLGIYGGAIGDARSVVDDLLVRRQVTVIKPMGKRGDLRVVDDLFVRRQEEAIKPTGKRVDLRVVDDLFVRRQAEVIKPTGKRVDLRVVDDLFVRRQEDLIKPMGKRVELRVVDDLFVRRHEVVIKPMGKRMDLSDVDGFFVRRQEEAIKPIAIGVGPIFVADALPAALATGHFCIIANPVFFQGVVPGFIVIDLVCVNRLMGRDGWGEATD